MVVLTAFIGMPGLGAKLLAMMGSFKIGRSFEIGITIVLIAIMLDRMSKAWVAKQPEHHPRDTPLLQRHAYLLVGVGLFAVFVIAAQFVELFSEISRRQSLSRSKEIDVAIKGFLGIEWVNAITEWLRWFLNVKILIPFRNALLWIPTPAFILLLTAAAWRVGGRRPALYAFIFFTIVAFSGWWDRSVITLYAVISAVIISAFIGIPLGIFAARSKARADRILLVCDTAQTFPSFIYLIPAIMLFGVNDVAVVFAIVIFTTVPLTRYTIEGLRSVPPETTEAADMSGATRRQKLWSVQIPIALPTMATHLGKNLVLGFNVSLMALAFAMTILAWAERRRSALGLD